MQSIKQINIVFSHKDRGRDKDNKLYETKYYKEQWNKHNMFRLQKTKQKEDIIMAIMHGLQLGMNPSNFVHQVLNKLLCAALQMVIRAPIIQKGSGNPR